jgi:hypothetical protein
MSLPLTWAAAPSRQNAFPFTACARWRDSVMLHACQLS